MSDDISVVGGNPTINRPVVDGWSNYYMIDTNQGFYCSREYLADSFFEASQIVHWLQSASIDEVSRRHGPEDAAPAEAWTPEAVAPQTRP